MYLRRTTSGASGHGLSRYRELLMCPITDVHIHDKGPNSSFFVRAYIANKQNSAAEVRGSDAMCVCGRGPSMLAVFMLGEHLPKPTGRDEAFLGRGRKH